LWLKKVRVKLSTQHPNTAFIVTFFEIYGGKCYDLLNKGAKINILEDKNNSVSFPPVLKRKS
jgi:kinesin family protein 2/24